VSTGALATIGTSSVPSRSAKNTQRRRPVRACFTLRELSEHDCDDARERTCLQQRRERAVDAIRPLARVLQEQHRAAQIGHVGRAYQGGQHR